MSIDNLVILINSVKIFNTEASKRITVIVIKWNIAILYPKDAGGLENSADPDQTAPKRTSLIWYCTVSSALSRLSSAYNFMPYEFFIIKSAKFEWIIVFCPHIPSLTMARQLVIKSNSLARNRQCFKIV